MDELAENAFTALDGLQIQPGQPTSETALYTRHSAAVARAPDVLALLFDELSHGVVVLRDDRHVLHMNEAARQELARCGALQLRGLQLQCMSPHDGVALQSALARAVQGQRSLLTLRAGGTALTLSVVPLKASADSVNSTIHDKSRHIALFFARNGLCDSAVFSFFVQSQGLTPTEEQVLVLLCRSMATPAIAVEMKVAVSTVRSHVRSLCAKTGCSGVRELLSRVATLPPTGLKPQASMH